MSDTASGGSSAEVDPDEGQQWTGPRVRRWLLGAVVVGALVWLVGAVLGFVDTVVLFGRVGMANPGRWIVWLQGAEFIGEALCIGSAAILVGSFVVQRSGS